MDTRDWDAPEPRGPRPRQGDSAPRFRVSWKGPAIVAIVLALLFASRTLKSIYVDFLWFETVGFESVFRTKLMAEIVLASAGAAISTLVIGGSLVLARRFAPKGREVSFLPELDPGALRRLADLVLGALVVLMVVGFASGAAGAWERILVWVNAVQFGQTDAQFGQDIAFFLFDLPALRFLQSWFIALLGASLLFALAVYGLSYALQEFRLVVTRPMRIHVSVLGGAIIALIAANTYLSVFDIVTDAGGIVYGGTYADINARLPARYALAAIGLLAAAAVAANGFLAFRGSRIPMAALTVWILAGVAGGLYAQVIQSLQVAPNELRREEPYIARHIAATREAWGLDRVDAVSHPANPVVTREEIDENPATLDNIRLLDPVPLNATLNELQALRPLYRFADIDISRYPLESGDMESHQQVLVSARELDLTRVGDRNWTRDRLQLTHGFGAIATPVTEVEEEGLPRLLLRDIPPRADDSRLELTVAGPGYISGS